MTVYSHSRLGTFETCPLKYKYQYIDKIERDEQGIEAFTGSRFHDVMEKLYGDLKFKVCSLEELIEFYEDRWGKEFSDEIVVKKKDRKIDDYLAMGRKCIEDYYKRYYPFNQSRTLGLEQRVSIDINGDGKYLVRGFIDRLSQAEDGVYEIRDYKTSGHLPEQKDADQDRQLALYQIGVQSMWNDVKEVRLIWHYVVFDKEITSQRTQEQLESLKKDVIQLIDTIEATKEFEPKESMLCNWCAYQDICPLKKHEHKVATLKYNEYMNDDGVKLVNTLRELSAKKKELNEEIARIDEEAEDVKEAIIAYAQREGLEVIKGSEYKVKIKSKDKYSFPSKGTDERKGLDQILKDAGLWDEFELDTLDTHALQKVLEEGRVSGEIAEKVLKYITVEPQTSVSLSKEKDNEE